MANPNVAHPQSFPSLHKSIWTIRKHIFCSQLPSHTTAPTFHISLLQFSQLVAELDVCTLLHCTVTLPLTLTMFNWQQSVYTASHMQSMLYVDSPQVSEEPCTCECLHTCAKLLFRYDTTHKTFETHLVWLDCNFSKYLPQFICIHYFFKALFGLFPLLLKETEVIILIPVWV